MTKWETWTKKLSSLSLHSLMAWSCLQALLKSIANFQYEKTPGKNWKHSKITRKIYFHVTNYLWLVVLLILIYRGITLCAFKCQEENCKAFRVTGHNRCQFGSVSKAIYAKKGIVVYSKEELPGGPYFKGSCSGSCSGINRHFTSICC